MERGETIAGRYELVGRLGRGGMGEVWAARDRNLRRDVAVKLLVLDDGTFPDLPKRFEREAVAAARINHPNVVALYDRGTHENILFLVMEKVDGATLTRIIQDADPIDPGRALTIADGICAALVAAHQAGVVHYDIKPHNVMLTPHGRVKVVDFGIAGFVQTAFSLAGTSQLAPAGTAEYGAPEQFLTERGDERSDLYALGSVLFAMLTGRPPFTGHNGLAIMRRKLDEDAPRLGTIRPDLPPTLTALVAALLDRDPARRPESARHVRERLRRLGAHHPEVDEVFDYAATTVTKPPSRTTTVATRSGREDDPLAMSWPVREMFGPAQVLPRRAAVLLGLVEEPDLNRFGWDLYVGPEHIAATDADGHQEFPWHEIRRVTIVPIRYGRTRFHAIHLRLADAARRPRKIRLAGFRRPPTLTFAVGGDERHPFCAIGPTTYERWVALTDAIAGYAGQRWVPPRHDFDSLG
ncbi:serine/threonine-protein kinase [Embleya sp. NBC_00896]|uniref:serine/threonine-protein kinase n=1 Tax=Embleya sp. NBC_00896 TaxID=2975961 RepID=UPI003863701E|nr:serine/threonine protein kinase [Embleya sp. NBC_00896]